MPEALSPVISSRTAGHKPGYARIQAGHCPAKTTWRKLMINSTGSAVQIIGKKITGVRTRNGTIYVPLKALCAFWELITIGRGQR